MTTFSSIQLNIFSEVRKPVPSNFKTESFSYARCKLNKLSFALYFNLIHCIALIQYFFYEI